MRRMMATFGRAGGPDAGARWRAAAPRSAAPYVEARTAEVFTGGCIMNGEAATTGREALLAWKVDRGSFDGVALDGLAVVAAVAGDTNLGIREIGGDVRADARGDLRRRARHAGAAHGARRDGEAALERHRVGTVVELTPTPIQFVDERPRDPRVGEVAAPDGREGNDPRPDLRRQAVVPPAR